VVKSGLGGKVTYQTLEPVFSRLAREAGLIP